jgi:NTE family protein
VQEIQTRTLELAFNANVMRKMSMFTMTMDFSSPKFLSMGRLERWLQSARFHMIDSSKLASLRRTETQVLAYGPFPEVLRVQGWERALAWLSVHADSVGRRSSIDVRECAV